ncbi:all3515 family Zur-repressed PEP-CTERM protein [Crocosphaera sp. UHCC 0190]|uniref:all3515 family Zur-repressed PEP-CTERM protein n=1 Tax=Crocosphaera sp. UHCC 0190 TaxID=3110246 RepID=UPI002B21C50E|nr:all3515 family Zur-repressed PEP-CTERM protein [Crocosphaera sp. UHCC 0190]MEA5510406.1 all3515 family Zur-repressed PEP-CTERM protein [Crocosphaera sp. UHCC 0190]
MTFLKPATNILLGSPLVALSIFSTAEVTLAQAHFGHHHMVVGRDSLETFVSGTYAGLANPNYNHLSLLFPHTHEPPENSHFHGIGIYSYTGPFDSPTIIPTNTNNQLPEISFNLPPLQLVQGTGAFKGQMVSIKTEDNIFSDLTTKPVKHLADSLDDPYIAGVYHSGSDRWNTLLGDNATIAFELVYITPGLIFADSNGQTLLDSIGQQTEIGKGDDFAFKPYVYAPQLSETKNYSATLRLIDLNPNEGERLLQSGEFTINFQAVGVPEPSILLGLGVFGFAGLCSKKRQ